MFTRKDEGFPEQLLNEMFTFVRNAKGRPEAMDRKHDDCVMAASIGYAILQEQEKYAGDSKPGEGSSVMKVMFGEGR